MNPVTMITDRRLPQPSEYPGVPADVREAVERWVQGRNRCPDSEVPDYDQDIIAALLPYRTDRPPVPTDT